jgi:hypothetical protein
MMSGKDAAPPQKLDCLINPQPVLLRQAEQEHALEHERKHAAALSAELEGTRSRLAEMTAAHQQADLSVRRLQVRHHQPDHSCCFFGGNSFECTWACNSLANFTAA